MRGRTARRLRVGLAGARSGSVLPLVGVMMSMLLAAVAFSVDYGAVFVARRRLQTAVDLAAIVAAQNPGDANRLVALSLADNGVATPATPTVEPGRYLSDPATPPSARFQAGAASPNAVRVTATAPTPLYFGRAILRRDSLDVTVHAVAGQANYASLTIGSRLASVNAGLVNAVLGSMLGAQLGLSLLDYNALLSARLDAFAFTDALASQIGVTAGSYNDVLAGQATIGQVLTAASRVGSVAVATALRQIVNALPSGQPRLALSGIASLGDLGAAPLGSHDPTHPMQGGAFDLVSAAAALANGASQVRVDLTAAAPGLAGATLTLSLGQPAQSAWISNGAPGASASTRQARLLMEVQVAAPLGLGRIALPLYLDLAAAQASLQALSCPWSTPDQNTATLSVRTGLATLAISDVAASAITAGGPAPSLTGYATLVAAPLVTVTGRAVASVANSAAQSVTFGNDDIVQHRIRTVSTTGLASSLTGSLLGGLALNVNVAGFGLSTGAVSSAVAAALSAATPAIDTLIDGTLRSLGLGVGQADVWMNSVSCGRASLVQ